MNFDRTKNTRISSVSLKTRFSDSKNESGLEKKKIVEVGGSGSQTNENPPNAFLFGQSELNREDVFIIFFIVRTTFTPVMLLDGTEFHKYLRFLTLGFSIEFFALTLAYVD